MDDENIPRGVETVALRTAANSVATVSRIDSLPPHELRRLSSQIFTVGVDAYGKGLAFAERMDVQTSVLSEMRHGKRIVPYHLVLGLLGNQDAAKAILERECDAAGFAMPVQTTVLLTTSQAQEIARMREFLAEMWAFAGESYARRYYGASREHLDIAVDLALRGIR